MERLIKDNSLLRHTLKTMISNKVRFFLTILGIILGVALFSFTVLNFDNSYRTESKKYEQFGENTTVLFGDFDITTYETISESLETDAVTFYYDPLVAKTGDSILESSVYFTGVHEDFLNMPIPDVNLSQGVYYSELICGRTFSDDEYCDIYNVGLISESSAHFLFGEENPLDKDLSITFKNNSVNFKIVGIIKDSFDGLLIADSNNESLLTDGVVKQEMRINFYVPQRTYDRFNKDTNYNNDVKNISMIVAADYRFDLSNLNKQLKYYFENPSNVRVVTSNDIADQFKKNFKSLKDKYLGLCIIFALLSCLILMVIMLFSIKERVYEIGLKKALGASNFDIAFQFIIEFFATGLIGSFLGVLLGIFAFSINGIFTMKGMLYFYIYPSLLSIITPFFIMLALIMVFSFIPALIASRVKIVDAIRFE